MIPQPQIVTLLHLIGTWRLGPFGHHLGALQQALRLLELGRHDDQSRHALVARPPGPTRPVQQRLTVRWQIGVDHQIKAGQINAARRHIRRNTHPRPPIAQGLQGMGPLGLRQLARQCHNLKATVAHPGKQMADIGAGLAEHQRRLGFVKPQQVEDRMFAVPRGNRQRAVFDIDMLPRLALRLNPQRIPLEILRQRRNLFRHRGREHQRPPLRRSRPEDIFQIFPEPQIQHLVRLIQHHSADAGHVQARPLDMVTQASRRAHNDVNAPVQRPLFGPVIHAADAGCNLCPCTLIQPLQLPRDLQRQLSRGGNAQGQRSIRIQQLIRPTQQFIGNRNAKGHRLARPGLRRHQQVTASDGLAQHGALHGGKCLVSLGCERRSQRGRDLNIGHVVS